jgi:hypothetical protein
MPEARRGGGEKEAWRRKQLTIHALCVCMHAFELVICLRLGVVLEKRRHGEGSN